MDRDGSADPLTDRLSLSDWLARLERLHPSEIELGLDRVGAVSQRLGGEFDCPLFSVAGTNGKGSSCAMLESILRCAGYRVGTYTSPHLVHFNERARIDGTPVDDARLIEAFEAVESARGDTSLTYFEFTTLAIVWIFQHARLDAVILEVGLGARLDAVNLYDADCAIVTCIDVDHVAWLGHSRDEIGWEKAHLFRSGRPAICSDPVPPPRLIAHAQAIGADLRLFGRDFNYAGDRQQWSFAGRTQRRNSLAYPALRGVNQLLNASGVLAALEAMRERLPVSQQAVRAGLAAVELPGRFQVLPGQPAIVLDVAHNPHAAAHLASNLNNMGFFPQTWAVFGAMADKDLDGVLRAMRASVDHWIVVGLPGSRAASAQLLAERVAALETDAPSGTLKLAASPHAGLEMALSEAGDTDRIVIFGSFLTVADILVHRARPAR